MIRVLVYGMASSTLGGIETFLLNMFKHFEKDKIVFDFIIEGNQCVFEKEIKSMGGKFFILLQELKICLKILRI